MLSLSAARKLQLREVLIAGNGSRWYVNGRVQTWKRDENRIRIPIKHGLYRYGQITGTAFDTLNRYGNPVSTYWSKEK